MKRLFTTLVLLCLSLSLRLTAQEQATAPPAVDPQKAALVREYLDLMGVSKMGQQVLTAIGDAARVGNPRFDEEGWQRFIRKFNADAMLPDIIAVYDRHLTVEDLQGLIAFYRSPLGQRVVKATPLLLQESMAVGQAWGLRMSLELEQELLKEEKQNQEAIEAAKPAGA